MLLNIAFSDAEIGRINAALLMLEETFSGKLISDSTAPDANEALQIEDVSSLPMDEGTIFRDSVPAFQDIPFWKQDEITSEQLSPIAFRLKTIAQQVVSTNRAVLQRCWNASAKY